MANLHRLRNARAHDCDKGLFASFTCCWASYFTNVFKTALHRTIDYGAPIYRLFASFTCCWASYFTNVFKTALHRTIDYGAPIYHVLRHLSDAISRAFEGSDNGLFTRGILKALLIRAPSVSMNGLEADLKIGRCLPSSASHLVQIARLRTADVPFGTDDPHDCLTVCTDPGPY
jgi:hypothetical protein